jgi:1,4-alpha-glucan branching enzyme
LRLPTILAPALLALAVGPAMGPAGAPPAVAAEPDNDIEWNGVFHVAWQDRRPVCPVNRETFQVRFQAYRNDLTAARLYVANGGAPAFVTAAKYGVRGPYDLWLAQVPAATADTLRYWIELTDGTDTDSYSANGMYDAGVPADSGFLVDFAKLSHAPVGATLVNGGGTVFKVWAPTRTTVHVRGDFNGWGTGNPMTKVGEHFITKVAPTTDRQAYKYYFDNSVWNTDARARSIDPSSSMNSVIENPFRYAWGDSAWTTPALEDMVIYQLHVGTFSGRNDPFGTAPVPARYADVTARVPHLVDLGVNAVMLNPVTEFPGDLSAGYNPQTAWAPEWKYGTPDELRHMVDVLHQNGVAVILDIVWNHLTTNDNFLWYYDGSQTYFDSVAVETPWGSQADFDKAAVRDYYANSALLWLEEYHLDGFRMDATDYMNIAPQAAAGWSLMQRFNDEKNRKFGERVTIAEQLPDDAAVTLPTGSGGAGFDCQYHDAFVDNVRQEILDAATGDPEMWRIRDAINGGGTYLSGRRVLHYVELHDEAWPTSGGQRLPKTIDTTWPHDDLYARGRVKLVQGLTLLAPGVPAFLMGGEWLEDTDFGVDAANKIDWSKKTAYASLYAFFQDAIALRRAWPAFQAGAAWQVYHLDETNNVLAFRRSDASGTPFVVIASFGNADLVDYRVGLPLAGEWQEILNSQDAAYGGDGAGNAGPIVTQATAYDGYPQSALITVPQMGLLVLAPAAVVGVPGADGGASGLRLAPSRPNPARGAVSVAFELPAAAHARLELFDLRGRLVRTLVDGGRAAGTHVARWDGRDASGAPAPAGVYFLRLTAAGATRAGRFALLR